MTSETWFLLADEKRASLVVPSTYGPYYEIEDWRRQADAQDFAAQVAGRLSTLQAHFDQLVVAAPPAMLEHLQRAYPEELRCKIGAEHARYLTHLSARELRQELSCL
ncbi:MAG: host attachment protein [Candidatus Eremiobacteraeota bacterium]|nr:host attachment protein [Candidatus Eremiobacteraeota bacterium]